MSFASDVKKEINNLNNLKNKELVKIELFGYLLSSNISFEKKKIKFVTENEYNINRFSRLLTNLGLEHKIDIKGKVFLIELGKSDIEIYIKEDELILKIEEFTKNENYIKALIRGLFMGSGTVTDPEKTYHLELAVNDVKKSDLIQNILFQYEIVVKQHNIENRYTIYIKDAEEISKFLALIGVNKAVMHFEDVRIQKEMNGKVNRLVNCKSANLNKTINASVAQIAAIKKIQKLNKMDNLDDNLKELAVLRLKYPDISLIELGEKLTLPIGKSGTNYRLKKIVEIANEL